MAEIKAQINTDIFLSLMDYLAQLLRCAHLL